MGDELNTPVCDRGGKMTVAPKRGSKGAVLMCVPARRATTRTTSAKQNTVGFTGQQLDPATGLSYYRARWYNHCTGAFINRDPEGFAAGDANLYRYVGNNPLTHTDPTGCEWQTGDSGGSSDPAASDSAKQLKERWAYLLCLLRELGKVGGALFVGGPQTVANWTLTTRSRIIRRQPLASRGTSLLTLALPSETSRTISQETLLFYTL